MNDTSKSPNDRGPRLIAVLAALILSLSVAGLWNAVRTPTSSSDSPPTSESIAESTDSLATLPVSDGADQSTPPNPEPIADTRSEPPRESENSDSSGKGDSSVTLGERADAEVPRWRPDLYGGLVLMAPKGADRSHVEESAHGTQCSHAHRAELEQTFAGSGIDFSKPLPTGVSFAPSGPPAKNRGTRGAMAAASDESLPAGPLAPISVGDVVQLRGSAFVRTILTSDGLDSSFFSTTDANTRTVLAETRVQEIVDGIRAELAAGPLTRATNIYQGLYFLRAASYVEFYSDQVQYSARLHTNVISLATTIGSLPELLDPGFRTPRNEWATLCDSWFALSVQVDRVTALLRRYLDTPAFQNLDSPANRAENDLVYALLSGIARTSNQDDQWAGRYTPGLMQALSDFALVLPDRDDIRFAINNGIYTLGNLRSGEPVAAYRGQAHQILSRVLQVRVVDGVPYLTALDELEDSPYDNRLADGTRFDVARYRQELVGRVFPNTYSYDNGAMIFKTPLDATKVAQLYDALREVKAQFFRVTQALRPRDRDTNSVLTLRIYGSLEDYHQYQLFLYGLGTDNGGIYIEDWATFFTYERTPEQSIYSLEELTRHEYVHYLDSYTLLTTRFGQSPWYDNSRLTWHQEGLAEFLDGSRRTNGVPVRERMLSQALSGGSGPMSIRDIIGVSYDSGFGFYPNAAMLFGFLHERHPELLWAYFRSLYTNSVSAYDTLTQGWRRNSSLQAEYRNFLTSVESEIQAGTRATAESTLTGYRPELLYGVPLERVRRDLQTRLPAGTIVAINAERFHLTAAMVVSLPSGSTPTPDRFQREFSRRLDTALSALTPIDEHFRCTTAWFE